MCCALLQRALRPGVLPRDCDAGEPAALRALQQKLLPGYRADPLFAYEDAKLERHVAAMAARAAEKGLHACALASCGAREVHASQHKRCSACLGVVYCCKEHQVQGWPAHKAACRAATALKAAKKEAKQAAADEASGA
jgi:hypothetical protein